MEVSVIIPVYNAAGYLEQAVLSALDQPEVREVILIEDASPDESLAVGTALSNRHSMVRLVRHPDGENHGAGASRNLGIRVASSAWVAFLDADDYFLPGRFSRAAEVVARQADTDGVYEAVGTRFEDEAARRRWAEEGRDSMTTIAKPVPPERLFSSMLSEGIGRFHTDGVVVRKELFRRTGLFDESLRVCQDTVMWFKLAAVGRLRAGRLEEPVAMRRVHALNRATLPETRRWASRAYWSLYQWAVEAGLNREAALLCLDTCLKVEFGGVNVRYPGRWRNKLAKAATAARVLARCPGSHALGVAALRVERLLREAGLARSRAAMPDKE